MAYLVVMGGPDAGTSPVKVDAVGILIARGAEGAKAAGMGAVLGLESDEFVTRASDGSGHARVDFVEGRWQVRDLGSKNTTWAIVRNEWHVLASGASASLTPAALFGCGTTPMLLIDVDDEPAGLLRKQLQRESAEMAELCGNLTSSHAQATTPVTEVPPHSGRDAAMALWGRVRRVLGLHGFEHLCS